MAVSTSVKAVLMPLVRRDDRDPIGMLYSYARTTGDGTGGVNLHIHTMRESQAGAMVWRPCMYQAQSNVGPTTNCRILFNNITDGLGSLDPIWSMLTDHQFNTALQDAESRPRDRGFPPDMPYFVSRRPGLTCLCQMFIPNINTEVFESGIWVWVWNIETLLAPGGPRIPTHS